MIAPMTSANENWLQTGIARHVWRTRYAGCDDSRRDHSIEDTWRRIARFAASIEHENQKHWEDQFFQVMRGFGFVPGGRILAGAGGTAHPTLFNCFVLPPPTDDEAILLQMLEQARTTLQAGGGVGIDFSRLAPRGQALCSSSRRAPGPVQCMHRWDAMCSRLLATGGRRGAMMATLRCDHPDILAFIDAKRDPRVLHHFNLSVQISDRFIDAVDRGREWPLLFPVEDGYDTRLHHPRFNRPGNAKPPASRVVQCVPAPQLWERIMRAAYDTAEPGVLFTDRINRYNNLGYRETITSTNPCGEIPLPSFGACNLGSINLARFVLDPFTPKAQFDLQGIIAASDTAIRLLDNVIDGSTFPLPQQEREARGCRRIGLGITGLADALIMLRLPYLGRAARRQAARVMQVICHTAYRSSIQLAREKGCFPYFDRKHYLQGRFIRTMPQDILDGIQSAGIRNSHLTAIAPTGSISLLANNISSGIEPVFDLRQWRRIRNGRGGYDQFDIEDHAYSRWRQINGNTNKLPSYFINAYQVEPQAHLLMQAALQPFVDSAISKTINIPSDFAFSEFQNLYRNSWALGLKGCTTFRSRPGKESILSSSSCCGLDRMD
jgi:ribonucleoside-diphosphate reductase alpha chain